MRKDFSCLPVRVKKPKFWSIWLRNESTRRRSSRRPSRKAATSASRRRRNSIRRWRRTKRTAPPGWQLSTRNSRRRSDPDAFFSSMILYKTYKLTWLLLFLKCLTGQEASGGEEEQGGHKRNWELTCFCS